MPKSVKFDAYGGIDALYVTDSDMPKADDDEVIVQVRAASINPGEIAIREGMFDAIWPATFPSGEGSDLAGVITTVGSAASEYAIGDEVIGWTHKRASHAEFAAVPINHLVRKPESISWEVAGALPIAAMTAYAAVQAVGAGSGDTVVVSAAAGGVGVITVQLLVSRGAMVIGIASEANHDWLRSVRVTPVAYGVGMVERIQQAAPNGVDALIDLYGPEYVRLAVNELGIAKERINTVIAFEVAQELGVKAEGATEYSESPDAVQEIVALVAAGKIVVPVTKYPLDKVQDAYTELAKRHTRGKIVLIP